VLLARSVLAVLCQLLVAVIFFGNSAGAWNEAGHWWRVYGTVIDIGCIILLWRLTRREGMHLFALGNYQRERWGRDILIGLALFVPVFLLTMLLPAPVVGRVIYGGPVPTSQGPLPIVALLYTLVIWPIIWAFAEDNIYFSYSLPRIEALTGNKWLAVIIVILFATLQHGFLPFKLDGQYWLYRCLTSLPSILALCLIYLRQRRLWPIHTIHWAGNVIGIVMLMVVPVAGGG
jgi:uncharacterized protein